MDRPERGAGIGEEPVIHAAHLEPQMQPGQRTVTSKPSDWFNTKSFLQLLTGGLNLAATVLFYYPGITTFAIGFVLAIAAAFIQVIQNSLEFKVIREEVSAYTNLKTQCERNIQQLPASRIKDYLINKHKDLGNMPSRSPWVASGISIGTGVLAMIAASFNLAQALGAVAFHSPIPFTILTIISVMTGGINALIIKNRIEAKQKGVLTLDGEVKSELLEIVRGQLQSSEEQQQRVEAKSLVLLAAANRDRQAPITEEDFLTREPDALARMLGVPYSPQRPQPGGGEATAPAEPGAANRPGIGDLQLPPPAAIIGVPAQEPAVAPEAVHGHLPRVGH